MAKDWYLKAAEKQFAALQTAKQDALTELAACKAEGKSRAGGEAVQRLADIASAEQNLNALVHGYIQSQQAPQQPQLTPEEQEAKPFHRMDYNDVWRMSAKSKYGVDENAFRLGIQEAARRRSGGE